MPMHQQNDNRELNFIEIFKEQNQNFNKMVEAGEKNSQNLR